MVTTGTVDGQAWSLWARRGVYAPNGIEQGGLVIRGRWYALCSGPLDGTADAASIELIDTPGRGTVYGYIQHATSVVPTLVASEPLPHPVVVPLRGTTFFIESLPRHACTYRTLTLHGQAPDWSGTTKLGFGACEPDLLVDIPESDGTWGRGTGH
jgi:hypothetical protein